MTLDWASLDGTSDYWVRFSPLCTPDGEVVGAVMIAQDITERWQAHRKLERQAVQQAAIAELGSLALLATPTEDLMQEARESLKETLHADVAAVLPYTGAGGLEIRAASGETAIAPPDARATDQPAQVMEYMRDAEKPLLIGDLRSSALRARVLEAEGMVSLIVAPIGPPSNRYGLLGAWQPLADAFTQDDLAFLQLMANALAGAARSSARPMRSTSARCSSTRRSGSPIRAAGISPWTPASSERPITSWRCSPSSVP